jgi:hypothetical protein
VVSYSRLLAGTFVGCNQGKRGDDIHYCVKLNYIMNECNLVFFLKLNYTTLSFVSSSLYDDTIIAIIEESSTISSSMIVIRVPPTAILQYNIRIKIIIV